MKYHLIVLCALVVLAVVVSARPPRCPEFCTLEYSPVCGINRYGRCKTFGNNCARRAYNCSHKTQYRWLKPGRCDSNCRSIRPYDNEDDY